MMAPPRIDYPFGEKIFLNDVVVFAGFYFYDLICILPENLSSFFGRPSCFGAAYVNDLYPQ